MTTSPSWQSAHTLLADHTRPRIMAIVNATPDSFSDGGLAFAPDAAIAHALHLVDQGADILDIGGESSRPGALEVPPDEELRRVLPVIEALRDKTPIPLSIDTTKASVARAAIEAGASIVNDISALAFDPAMAPLVAETGAAVVLMHMRGTPRTMRDLATYDDVVTEVIHHLHQRAAFALAHGIPRSHIALDPGIGFAKTNDQSLALLKALPQFTRLGYPLLVGTSRKNVLGTLTGRPIHQRATASAVSALAAIVSGARIVRVHDVAATRDALTIWEAQHGWEKQS